MRRIQRQSRFIGVFRWSAKEPPVPCRGAVHQPLNCHSEGGAAWRPPNRDPVALQPCGAETGAINRSTVIPRGGAAWRPPNGEPMAPTEESTVWLLVAGRAPRHPPLALCATGNPAQQRGVASTAQVSFRGRRRVAPAEPRSPGADRGIYRLLQVARGAPGYPPSRCVCRREGSLRGGKDASAGEVARNRSRAAASRFLGRRAGLRVRDGSARRLSRNDKLGGSVQPGGANRSTRASLDITNIGVRGPTRGADLLRAATLSE